MCSEGARSAAHSFLAAWYVCLLSTFALYGASKSSVCMRSAFVSLQHQSHRARIARASLIEGKAEMMMIACGSRTLRRIESSSRRYHSASGSWVGTTSDKLAARSEGKQTRWRAAGRPAHPRVPPTALKTSHGCTSSLHCSSLLAQLAGVCASTRRTAIASPSKRCADSSRAMEAPNTNMQPWARVGSFHRNLMTRNRLGHSAAERGNLRKCIDTTGHAGRRGAPWHRDRPAHVPWSV
eukprot:7376209-Prymnesium_polylepis.1